jgi:hypothetical protein
MDARHRRIVLPERQANPQHTIGFTSDCVVVNTILSNNDFSEGSITCTAILPDSSEVTMPGEVS